MEACNLWHVSKSLMSIKTPPKLAIPLTEHIGRPFSISYLADEMPNVFTDSLIERDGNKITGIILLKAVFQEKVSGFICTRSLHKDEYK